MIRLSHKYQSEKKKCIETIASSTLSAFKSPVKAAKIAKCSPNSSTRKRPTTAYSINKRCGFSDGSSSYYKYSLYSHIPSNNSFQGIEIKGIKVNQKEEIKIKSEREIQINKLRSKEILNSLNIRRRSSLTKPSASNKASPSKLKIISSYAIEKELLPMPIVSYKQLIRYFLRKRNELSNAPMLVIGFEGILGDFIKASLFSQNAKLYTISGVTIIEDY
jgi:hypothetical protein